MSFFTELVAFAIVGDARYGVEDPPEYPCDTCPAEGHCLKHQSCKKLDHWKKHNK